MEAHAWIMIDRENVPVPPTTANIAHHARCTHSAVELKCVPRPRAGGLRRSGGECWAVYGESYMPTSPGQAVLKPAGTCVRGHGSWFVPFAHAQNVNCERGYVDLQTEKNSGSFYTCIVMVTRRGAALLLVSNTL